MPTLTLAVATLYELGLRLHKINFSACYNAGSMTKGWQLPEQNSEDKSLLTKFCGALAKAVHAVGKHDQLDGVMVAGYRQVIIMHDAAPSDESLVAGPFFKHELPKKHGMVPAHEKEALVLEGKQPGGGVHNTFESGNVLRRTHPREFGAEQRDIVTRSLEAVTKVTKPAAKESKFGEAVGRQTHRENTPVPLIKEIEQYVLSKLVFVYAAATRTWRLGSLADYTDNANLRDMVNMVVNPQVMPWPGANDAGYRFQVTLPV
jgi:hypothetical protein